MQQTTDNYNEGLVLLIDCLNDMLDKSGKRPELLTLSKRKVMSAYDIAQKFLTVEEIQKFLKVNSQKVFRLRTSGRCDTSISKNCIRLTPNQLSISEQILIRRFLLDKCFEHLPLNHIWAEAQRRGLIISKSTFYKYVRQINGVHTHSKKTKESKPTKFSIHATAPFEILHMDSTILRCGNGERVYIHFIMDNYSRKVLGAVATYSSKSMVVAKNLIKVIKEYKLANRDIKLYCDDGPENKGYVTELLNKNNIRVKKIVANHATKMSNNMIEAWNKKFKQVILKKYKVASYESLQEKLPKMISYFNNLNLPVLRTLSPNEVASGVCYEDLQLNEKIAEAKANRLVANRQISCKLKLMLTKANFSCKATLAKQRIAVK